MPGRKASECRKCGLGAHASTPEPGQNSRPIREIPPVRSGCSSQRDAPVAADSLLRRDRASAVAVRPHRQHELSRRRHTQIPLSAFVSSPQPAESKRDRVWLSRQGGECDNLPLTARKSLILKRRDVRVVEGTRLTRRLRGRFGVAGVLAPFLEIVPELVDAVFNSRDQSGPDSLTDYGVRTWYAMILH
jgi:hypothetical protein